MKILFCSPEVYPYSKAGGVADFSASLPKEISKFNNIVHVITPLHQVVRDEYNEDLEYIGERTIFFDGKDETAKYYKLENDGVNYYFIGHKFYNKYKFFGHDDDVKRYMFFNLAILEFIKLTGFYPDVMHINDWTTSLIPFMIDSYYENDPGFENIKTLLTIHNLEKQGSYPRHYENLFLHKNFTYLHLDQINFLKTGIMRSTKINTVSKSYRSEMLTKFFGFALDGALKSRQLDLTGIQNGLDFELYDPETDRFIYQTYNIDNVIEAKAYNKEKLYEELELPKSDKILVSFIGRFAKQKGISLIIDIIDEYLEKDLFNFVIVGQGDWEYERYFTELQKQYPNNVRYIEGLKHRVSQKVYAASDFLLMPSLFESSGLNQMIAQRYGTIPIVRYTGGLKDTVKAYDKSTKTGNGFTFNNFDDEELDQALKLAIYYYHNEKEHLKKIIENAMQIDNDIDTMAKEYNEIYKQMIK